MADYSHKEGSVSGASFRPKTEEESIDLSTASSAKINTYIQSKQELYEKHNWADLDLWESFTEDFHKFTEGDFNKASKSTLRDLRRFLRLRGVWVRQDKRKGMAESLVSTAQEEEPTEWADDKVNEHIRTAGPFLSHAINYRLSGGRLLPVAGTAAIPTPAPTATRVNNLQTLIPFPPQERPQIGFTPATPRYALPTGPKPVPRQTPAPTLHPAGPAPRSTDPPPLQSTTVLPACIQGYGVEIGNVAEMYTKEDKYSGFGDSFDFKLMIFNDICSRADVPQEAKAKAFPIMLKGPAQEFFYAGTSVASLNFTDICDAFRSYFEGPDHQVRALAKWNETTLKSVIARNKGKPITDCLYQLLNELRQLQYSLDPSLWTNNFMRNKLVIACRDVPACRIACSNPAPTVGGLVNVLRESIKAWEASNESVETSPSFTDR